eukprot:3681086-Pleurochrysis_carterae.AAC.1
MVLPSELPAAASQLCLSPPRTGNAASRRGGGQAAERQPAATVVDMREFRSALPNMLHLQGFTLHPVTLEVGDYVLTPDVVVERKSISDLVQSLGSGRLYNQAENMLRYYKRAAVLIEFEENRQFSLINPSELSADISPNSLISKLCLLLIHFPKLRLLWSRRPLHTVALFAALKRGQPEPDTQTAAALGASADGAEQVFNMAPQDMLRQLPGVHAHNYRKIMNSVTNLQELAGMSLQQLTEIMGAQNAQKLHEFLNRTV